MAWIYSTGAVNFRSGNGSSRKMWNDFVLDLYGGATPPASADAAAAGQKLARITVGSGAVTTTMRSVAQIDTLVPANRTNANTVKVGVVVEGLAKVTYTYTFVTAVDSSDLIAAINIARWLEDNVPQLQCIGYGALTIAAKCKIDGLLITLTDETGTTAITVTQIQAYSRASIYTLQFGPPALGVISKTSDVWSGVGLITGVATYGRLVLPTDDGTLSSTQVRAQGAISTSGAEITMSNTTVTLGATSTVDAASITMPTGA